MVAKQNVNVGFIQKASLILYSLRFTVAGRFPEIVQILNTGKTLFQKICMNKSKGGFPIKIETDISLLI